MDPSFEVPGYGDHMQRSMQTTHNFKPQIAPSGIKETIEKNISKSFYSVGPFVAGHCRRNSRSLR
eukprot:1158672-Pelagomonas_calceolata.AAC.19